jgi:hypothetical protein
MVEDLANKRSQKLVEMKNLEFLEGVVSWEFLD